jgi:hypothetical protein
MKTIYLQTVEAGNMMGIDLLTFPAHTTHRLQPLDVSVFGPFNCYCKAERVAWMVRNLDIKVKRFELEKNACNDLKGPSHRRISWMDLGGQEFGH